MRKYVVPIVALAGIALLSPRADAANLVIKSRLGVPGHPVSLPVAVTFPTGSTLQLWGLDFAFNYSAAGKLAPGNDATYNAAFTPQAVTGSTEVPVVVSGTPTVGTGATNPDLYVGIVRGTSAFTTTANAQGAPTSAIGLLRLTVTGTLAADKGTVINLAVPQNYNVANTGNGSTTNSRPGATGATSTATAGDPVLNEPITVLDTMPGPSSAIKVPLHKVAIGAMPGDVRLAPSGQPDAINSGDYTRLAQGVVGTVTLTDYEKIAGDVAPNNGYVPGTNFGGNVGLSYGDGIINSGDYTAIAQKVVGTATNFPVAE